jgi:hypothetical protein
MVVCTSWGAISRGKASHVFTVEHSDDSGIAVRCDSLPVWQVFLLSPSALQEVRRDPANALHAWHASMSQHHTAQGALSAVNLNFKLPLPVALPALPVALPVAETATRVPDLN